MKKICFVGPDNYPVLNPSYGNNKIGGESVQQTLIAREFACRGFEVSMIVKDLGQPQEEIIDNIRCIKAFKPGSGLPGLRYLYPNMWLLWKALSMADADIYYQSCASFLTGLTSYYAQRQGAKMIFRVAHDTDCISGQQLIPYKRDKLIYEYGLRNATFIASQSDKQSQLLVENYSLDSSIVNMLVEEPKPEEIGLEKDIDILWVNNIRPIKRPDRLIEVAKKLPQFQFTMIGGHQERHHDLYDEVKAAADTLPNLNFLGAIPYAEVGAFFSRARLFLNTSDSEGFPNTFLQAWIRGVPVVSTFDPDGIIDREELGISVGTVLETTNILKTSLEGAIPDTWKENALAYIQKHHSAESIVDDYLECFRTS